jgi:uncharacterized membrane-anchored protein
MRKAVRGRLSLMFALAAAAFAPAAAVLAPAATAGSPATAKDKAFARSVTYRTGTIAILDARIALPHGFRYLNARDAQRTLTFYGNPRHSEVRALILPPHSNVLSAVYFIVATYEADGHVSDSDAAKIDYDKLLRGMQSSEKSDNEERAKQGFDPIHMVGWAEPPHYDATNHKLYWASNLVFGNEPVHTLNYEVRTLGREGMLALNAVAAMRDIRTVRSGMQTVLRSSRFVHGRRYEDYRKGDKVSKLTVAAVVAGGAYAVAKTGLFALLIAKLKFIVVGIAGLVGALRKRIFRRSRRTADEF